MQRYYHLNFFYGEVATFRYLIGPIGKCLKKLSELLLLTTLLVNFPKFRLQISVFFFSSLASGIQDTRENCWKFFIDRVRRQLKVVLCFSPVGNTLRIRSRKFPAITNCTAIDWFHEWPEEALFSVSRRFLEETEQVLVSGICFVFSAGL